MAVEGAIAERLAGIFPVTFDALSRETKRFDGDGLLRSAIDTTKERIFGTVVSPVAEAAYPLMVIDYVAKLVAIEIIPTAIDYWMSEPITVSTTGTNETTSYTDRANQLRLLREDLLKVTRAAAGEMAPLIGFTRISNAPVPKINTMTDEFLTPSPQEFPRPYAVTDRS